MQRGSQYGEDKWIAEHLSPPGRGVFVEVGGHDGLENSNTVYFEDRGWTGVVCEGDPRNFHDCGRNRPRSFVGYPVGTKPRVEFVMDANPGWSGVNIEVRPGQHSVMLDALRLDYILDTQGIKEIDLLSIDTEGTELDVWNSFSPSIYRPKIVIMEYDTVGQPPRDQEILGRLACDGYIRVHQTPCNLILVRA